jgi:Putative metal-binding motif
VLLAFGVWLAVFGLAAQAQARAGGIAASGCSGCHNGGAKGTLSLAANPAMFTPGQTVQFTLSIMGGYSDGGTYISTADIGTLQAPANSGLTKVSSGLVHNQPKPASGGAVTFGFSWVAPTKAGAVRFQVYAIGGNNNGRSSGDTPLDGTFDFVYGCTGKTFYLDGDGDGVGRADFSMLGCADAPPMAFVSTTGDCDDYRKTVYPGAKELCNMLDDNCDGQIDENAVPVDLWPDADGDGYYDARTEMVGTPKVGCAGLKGWAAEPGDCQPQNKAINPGAMEVCNNVDDDCDGDVDERVRPTCGEGWCRREAPGCDLMYCMPGAPTKEKCNFLDDDCDGLTDEDPDMCPTGQTCAAGTCVDSDQVTLDPMGNPVPIAGASSVGTSGSTSTANSNTGSSAATGGSSGGLGSDGSGTAGCALGANASHGALAMLGLLLSTAALRRRRRH